MTVVAFIRPKRSMGNSLLNEFFKRFTYYVANYHRSLLQSDEVDVISIFDEAKWFIST